MIYAVELSRAAMKDLKQIDHFQAEILTAWMKKNLDGCDNPRRLGTALQGNYKGLWRYRVGKYRVIAQIQDDKVLILVLAIGHRKNIY